MESVDEKFEEITKSCTGCDEDLCEIHYPFFEFEINQRTKEKIIKRYKRFVKRSQKQRSYSPK